MSLRDPEGHRHDDTVERSKIAIGRTPKRPNQRSGEPWWRVTIYVGDTRTEIDAAIEEALRIDALLHERIQ